MNGYEFQLGKALGGIEVELRANTRAIMEMGDRLEGQLTRMGERVESAVERSTPKGATSMSTLERWVKGILTYGVPLATAWATGSIEKGMQMLSALK